ncbi:tetratricopeptide repeat protein [bacterium]|nr:tetratricopeptide repeat protein [bacterium]
MSPDYTKRLWLPALALAVLIAVAFLPAVRAGFIWDDDDYVTENETLRSLDGLRRIWFEVGATPQYYPLVHTSFWIEHRLWELNATGYHLVNILLHILNGVLLYLLLRRLRLPGAWLGAALFALHPLQVESVAWITERKNVLSLFFYLAAFHAYLKALGPVPESVPPGRLPRAGLYVLSLLLFIAALLSKTVTISLPVALGLVLWMQHRFNWRTAASLVPYLIVGAGPAALTIWMERHVVGAAGEDWKLSFIEHLLLAGRILWFYPWQILWPRELAFIYERWSVSAGVWWQYLFPLAAAGTVAALWFWRKRIGRGPLVAVLFYVVAIAPALGFIHVFPMRYSWVADHFQYLAGIGLFVLAGSLIWKMVEKVRLPSRRQIVQIALAALLILLVSRVWLQTRIYANPEVLWRDTIAKTPSAWIAHNNLGNLLNHREDRAEAVKHLFYAIHYNPDYAMAYANLASVLVSLGRIDLAIQHCTTSLRLEPHNPIAHNNLGVALQHQGRLDEAIIHYGRSLVAAPNYEVARQNLESARARLAEIENRLVEYRRKIEHDPRDIKAHVDLGNEFAALRRNEQAAERLRQALALEPRHVPALEGLVVLQNQQEKYAEAAETCQFILEIDPRNVDTRHRLAQILESLEQPDAARAEYERVLAIDPDHSGALNDLGILLAKQGDYGPALDLFRKILEKDPEDALAQHNMTWAKAQKRRAGQETD